MRIRGGEPRGRRASPAVQRARGAAPAADSTPGPRGRRRRPSACESDTCESDTCADGHAKTEASLRLSLVRCAGIGIVKGSVGLRRENAHNYLSRHLAVHSCLSVLPLAAAATAGRCQLNLEH
jgi:hypothetical protein